MLRREFMVLAGAAVLGSRALADKTPGVPGSKTPRPLLPVFTILFRNEKGKMGTKQIRATDIGAARQKFEKAHPKLTVVNVTQ